MKFLMYVYAFFNSRLCLTSNYNKRRKELYLVESLNLCVSYRVRIRNFLFFSCVSNNLVFHFYKIRDTKMKKKKKMQKTIFFLSLFFYL